MVRSLERKLERLTFMPKSASGKTFRCKVAIKSLPVSKSPKMLLPNQKECGNADFFIEYNSQRSTGGKVVPIQVYKDFPMGYINYYAENLNQELNTYIYVDGVLWNNSRGACISGGSSLDGAFIKKWTSCSRNDSICK